LSARETSAIHGRGTLKRQLPSFLAIGVFGYFVDSTITYTLARGFGVDPLLARLPAFAVATCVNFGLNRAFTFSESTTPLLLAFVRYIMVCALALLVNYSFYASAILIANLLGYVVTPSSLPLFVACGTGVAMFVTFFGFRMFAFRA
jgi:putative flippase GtrA